MIQVSSIRGTSVAPHTFLLRKRCRSESSCRVGRERSFGVDIYCNFFEKWERDWKCCEDGPFIPWEEEAAGKGPYPAAARGSEVLQRAHIVCWC